MDNSPVLGPNDCLPCPSDSARARHRIRCESCVVCGVEGRDAEGRTDSRGSGVVLLKPERVAR